MIWLAEADLDLNEETATATTTTTTTTIDDETQQPPPAPVRNLNAHITMWLDVMHSYYAMDPCMCARTGNLWFLMVMMVEGALHLCLVQWLKRVVLVALSLADGGASL